MDSKPCTKCGEIKPLTLFSAREKGGRLLKSSCIDCERLRSRENKKRRSSTIEGKYLQHKENANTRGVEFELTLTEWTHIWTASGYFSERGIGANKYCMCRINDTGAYAVGNVYIETNKHNVSTGNIGKVLSDETKAKMSKAQKGQKHPWSAGANNPMHRQDVKDKISLAIGGANHYAARGVNTPQGFFATAKLAAEALSMKKPTVEWRARHNKFGFSLPEAIA